MSQIYAAERLTSHAVRPYPAHMIFMDIHEAGVFVECVKTSNWWFDRFGTTATPLIREAPQDRDWAVALVDEGWIELPPLPKGRWAYIKPTVLHEIAHFAQARGTPWHGHTFARVYLELLDEFVGEYFTAPLRKRYKARGITPELGLAAGRRGRVR